MNGIKTMSGHASIGHGHGNTTGTKLYWALALTLGFSVVEIFAGWQSGSLALLADAGHMVTDGAALGLAAFSAWLAARPPSNRHSYGWGRVELLAALINAITMLVVLIGIGYEAWQRFSMPQTIQGGTVSVVAGIGLLVNLTVAWSLFHGQANLNVRAAFVHVLGDLLGSVAALIAGVVIWLTGWTPIDPLLSLLIGGIVLSSSLKLLRDSLHGLLDGVPWDISLPELATELTCAPDVRQVADLHVWPISAERVALSAHVYMPSLERWDATLSVLTTIAGEKGITHCTFQPMLMEENAILPEQSYICGADPQKHEGCCAHEHH
jgi:cobalt-zinc-cadmium efflux system protein